MSIDCGYVRAAKNLPINPSTTCNYALFNPQVLRALILLVLVAGCEHVRVTHVVEARALYAAEQGDVVGHVLVDGSEVAPCARRWSLPEIVCDVDVEILGTQPLRLELALDIGAASIDVDPRSLHDGRHVVRLDSRAPLFAVTAIVDVRTEPLLPWDAAVVLAILAGTGAAFALFFACRARFADNDRFAIVVARVASVIAQAAVIPVAAIAKTTEPIVVALPTLVGAFAAATTIIGAVVHRRLGSHRVALLASSIIAAAAMPLIIAVHTISVKYVIVIAVVMAIVAFV